MEKSTCVTLNDYDRIMGFIEFASLKYRVPDMVDRLVRELKAAKIVSSQNMPADVITMNTCVRLKDIGSGRETEITVTYPDQADSGQGKISVFSPIGTALIGCRVGDIASWRVPGGIGHFRIEKIIYQPEAAGHFHL